MKSAEQLASGNKPNVRRLLIGATAAAVLIVGGCVACNEIDKRFSIVDQPIVEPQNGGNVM